MQDHDPPDRTTPFTVVHQRYRPVGTGKTIAVYEDAAAARAARLPTHGVDFARDVLVELTADASSWPASLEVDRVVTGDEGTVVHAYVDVRADGDDQECRPSTTIRLRRTMPRPISFGG